MNAQGTYDIIKATVNVFLPGSRVLLFGSRASGKADVHSDYDLLVVTPSTLGEREKIKWESKIRRALVYALNAPFDVILQSKNEVDEKKQLMGHIVRYAMKDAIEL